MCKCVILRGVRTSEKTPPFIHSFMFLPLRKKEHKLSIDLAQSHPTVNGFYRAAAPENSNGMKLWNRGKLFSKRFDTGGQKIGSTQVAGLWYTKL